METIYQKPDFIDRTTSSTKHIVWLFIKMIDEVQVRYSDRFHQICEHVLLMSDVDILNLKFNQYQFERLRDIYLIEPDDFHLEAEIIGCQQSD